MNETHEFLVPDYFPEFHCKMGGCRHACCEGWPISVTMRDYFKLLGVACSEKLRRRLDVALHICEHPTEDRYAQMMPRYDGNCSMRYEDGRCGLQMELGEEALSAVCRLYPRGIRSAGVYEVSCANSCEAVLELFWERREPLQFIRRSFTFDMPEAGNRFLEFASSELEQQVRLFLIGILQNRSMDMPCRLMTLGKVLKQVNAAVVTKDTAALIRLMESPVVPFVAPEGAISQAHLMDGLPVVEAMVEKIGNRSAGLHAACQVAEEWFHRGEPLEQYERARGRFERLVPQGDYFIEHALVNHLFFEQFPFQDRPMDCYDELIGLCAGYSLLRFLALGWMAEHDDLVGLMDVCAATFRLVDHIAFEPYGCALLKELNFYHPEELYELVRL